MSAIFAFFRIIYEQKEKVILGILVIAFVGVAFLQWKSRKNGNSDSDGGKSVEQLVQGNWKPSPPREPRSYSVPALTSPYKLERYLELIGGRNIFEKPGTQADKGRTIEEARWPAIRVKSIFDPTRSNKYIAIIEVDKHSRIVKEGDEFDGFEVMRIDGIRNCLTIQSSALREDKEFCKKDE